MGGAGSGKGRTPAAILEARGSRYVADRNEPVAVEGTPEKPDWLDGNAGDVWDYLAPLLEGQGTLAVIDAGALARYCSLYQRWHSNEQILRDEGSTYETCDRYGSLNIKLRPEAREARALAGLLRQLEHDFGLSPGGRAGLDASLGSKQQTGPVIEGRDRSRGPGK